MQRLFLIRGLPGSGKSTLATQMQACGLGLHYEADMYHLDKNGVYNYNPDNRKAAHEWCQESTRSHLQAGGSVIVSNTFTQWWEMQPYYDMAELLCIPVVTMVCTGQFQNIHGVPAEAIERMRQRWEN